MRTLITSKRVILPILLGTCLITRLPLMTSSIPEVDAANFYNALVHGYDISLLRPHAPGYPVYMLGAWYFSLVIRDPLSALTLFSAISGSLAIIPLYLLIQRLVGWPYALAGGILFIANPLVWSHSETALSDVPSMALVILALWLTVSGRSNRTAFVSSFVVMSLAIGVRLSNLPLALVLYVPLLENVVKSRTVNWPLWYSGTLFFAITTLAWLVPMVLFAGGGIEQYLGTVHKQWATAVQPTGIYIPDPAAAITTIVRIERFVIGYFITYPPTGIYTNSLPDLLMTLPWVFGFALFVVSFRAKDFRHLLVLAWIIPVLLQSAVIHFLPRYGLPYWPGFLIACLIGYQFLSQNLSRHHLRVEILSLLGISSLLIAYGIKHQAPLRIFESTISEWTVVPVLLIILGFIGIVSCKWVVGSSGPERVHDDVDRIPTNRSVYWSQLIVLVFLCLSAIPQLTIGYRYVSSAHTSHGPNEQMVEFIEESFETDEILACWDNQTHSLLEIRLPGIDIAGYDSLDGLLTAMSSQDKTLLFTDRCKWVNELTARFVNEEIGYFQGDNPLWVKTPSIHLYAIKNQLVRKGDH